jgi:hypothetical protein
MRLSGSAQLDTPRRHLGRISLFVCLFVCLFARSLTRSRAAPCCAQVPYLQYRATGHAPARVGIAHPSIAPYGAYPVRSQCAVPHRACAPLHAPRGRRGSRAAERLRVVCGAWACGMLYLWHVVFVACCIYGMLYLWHVVFIVVIRCVRRRLLMRSLSSCPSRTKPSGAVSVPT